MKRALIFSLMVLGIILAGCSNCEKITSVDERNNCYQDTAFKNKDVKICDKITDSTRDSCIWNVARARNDIALCEKIPVLENKEWCYHEIAQLNKDPAVCDKISSQDAKDKCNECLDSVCGV